LAQNPEGFYVQTITIFTMHRLKSGFFRTDYKKLFLLYQDLTFSFQDCNISSTVKLGLAYVRVK